MLPPLVEGLRVTLEKGSQDQDFTQVRFTLTQAQGGLTIYKGGRPTDSGWYVKLSGISGDILVHISCSWLLGLDRH